MKIRNLLINLAFLSSLAFFTASASAALVMKMGLGDLVGNAEKVFRGTVLTKEPGTVSMGGSEFSTVVYTLRVDDALKGNFDAKPVVTLTMLGNLKSEVSSGNMQRLSALDMNPDLQVGGDYVLFTTAPSAVGLSTTVGLNQGLFHIFNDANGRELTANGLGNQGIFGGPVSYADFKAAINAETN